MKKKLLSYAITTVVGLAIALTIMLSKDVFGQTKNYEVMRILCDSFFVPGVLLAGVGVIIFASNGGAFDMLAYGAIMFFDLFKKDLSKRKYKDFYSYREAKKGTDRSMSFMLVVGLAFIIIAACFMVAYLKMI
jgi:hypothetical protein